MKNSRWLDLGTPLFVISMLLLLGIAFAIGLTVDRIVKLFR